MTDKEEIAMLKYKLQETKKLIPADGLIEGLEIDLDIAKNEIKALKSMVHNMGIELKKEKKSNNNLCEICSEYREEIQKIKKDGNEWISCSKGTMPRPCIDVLVTYSEINSTDGSDNIFQLNEERKIGVMSYFGRRAKWGKPVKVYAWQPLPMVYQDK